MTSLTDMIDHVELLAAAHGVALTWIPGWRHAESWPDSAEAVVPVIDTLADYFVAMHELGHCLDPLARSWADRTDAYGVIVCEGAAWAWAADNVLPGLGLRPGDWDRAGRCFRSYLVIGTTDEEQPEPHVPGSPKNSLSPTCPYPRVSYATTTFDSTRRPAPEPGSLFAWP